MKDQLISFETAKLAKEKGFDEICYCSYNVWRGNIRKSDTEETALNKYLIIDDNPYSRDGNYVLDEFKNSYSKEYITSPTQSLLQKWLREEHNWHIIIFTDDGDLEYDNLRYYFEVRYIIPSFKGEDKDSLVSEEGYKTYEEALEFGLLEALQLIK